MPGSDLMILGCAYILLRKLGSHPSRDFVRYGRFMAVPSRQARNVLGSLGNGLQEWGDSGVTFGFGTPGRIARESDRVGGPI